MLSGTNLQRRGSRRGRGIRRLTLSMVALAVFQTVVACGNSSPATSTATSTGVQSDPTGVEPDYDFYRGKTLNIMVANAAGTTLSNSIAVLEDSLEETLGASVRINYNTTPTVAAMNAAASQPADGLHLGALSVPTASAHAIYNQPLTFDLSELSWIGATANDLSAAYACGPNPEWTTFEEFLNNSTVPVKVTGVYGGSSYLLNIAVLKAFGGEYEMLTGYTSETIGVSCTRGDANFRIGSAGSYTNSAGTASVPGALPLLVSGEAPSDSPMRFLNDEVPTLEAFLETYEPETETERELLNLATAMFATDIPNEALYAPNGVPAERLAALREAFAKAATEPEVQETWLRLGLPPDRYFGHDEIEQNLQTTVADLPRVRELLDITD